MISQTITLIRYFLSAYLTRKNNFIVLALLAAGYLSSQFIGELSLSEGAGAQLAFQIEFYRYVFVLFSTLLLIVSVADDFESRQFEVLLSMPLHRWQYVAAQVGVIFVLSLMLSVAVAIIISIQSGIMMGFVLLASFCLELVLVSAIALLAVISLEKIPSAVMLTISLYILSRSSDSIVSIVEMSVHYSDDSFANLAVLYAFQFIQYVLPSSNAFVSNDLFFSGNGLDGIGVWHQTVSVLIYSSFIVMVTLFDFYRKEYALKQ